jgi:hypothetical protein
MCVEQVVATDAGVLQVAVVPAQRVGFGVPVLTTRIVHRPVEHVTAVVRGPPVAMKIVGVVVVHLADRETKQMVVAAAEVAITEHAQVTIP